MREFQEASDGIKREIEEETKLEISIGKLINLNSGFKLRVECTYLGFCEDASKLTVNPDEVLEAKFFKLNELPDGLLESHTKLIQLASKEIPL